MKVVVEVVGQRRWSCRGSETEQTPLAERAPLRIIVGAGRRLETAVVVGQARTGQQTSGDALPCGRRQLRQPAIRRVDDDRCADLAVDDRERRAGIEPERVVTADVPGRAHRPVATLRRRRPLTVDRLRAFIDLRRNRAFELRDFLAREHCFHPSWSLERCQRGQIVGALQIRATVGQALRRIRLRAMPHDGCRFHRRQQQPARYRHDERSMPHNSSPLFLVLCSWSFVLGPLFLVPWYSVRPWYLVRPWSVSPWDGPGPRTKDSAANDQAAACATGRTSTPRRTPRT